MEVNGTPTLEGYEWFSAVMKQHLFQEISRKQIKQDYTRLGIEKKIRNVEGVETGFVYASPYSRYKVIVWVTWLKAEQKLRDIGTDAGWNLIAEDDDAKYFSRPFLRSNKNFFLAIFRYAWTSKWKIDNVPICPCEECGSKMKIARKIGTRQYFWQCKNEDKHEKPTSRKWDYGVPPKALDWLNIRRSNTAKYKAKNEKAFKETGKALPIPAAIKRRVRKKTGTPDAPKE